MHYPPRHAVHAAAAENPEPVAPHRADPDVILEQQSHRPWPIPATPWIMRQSWCDLLFAHWPVPVDALRPHVPAPLALDAFDGSAWLGVVPFQVRDARPRGLPGVPSATEFLELNVRTYVTVDGKPGVHFFSLDAGSALAVLGGRTFFRLRYFEAEMHRTETAAGTHFRSRRLGASGLDVDCTYQPAGEPAAPQAGSLEHFLTERYCLYTAHRRHGVSRVDIHHRRWPLQPAAAEFRRLGVARGAGVEPPVDPPLLHYAAEQHVLIWPPESVTHE